MQSCIVHTPQSGVIRFGGGVSSCSRSKQKTARVDLTFELEASINLTPSELFAEVKARSSLILPSIDDMEVEQNGGGSGNPGWKYIYLKGLGFHVCGYWHNCSEHYSEVGCKTIGGHSRATARRERWAVSASWYVPIISTNSTYYRYGTCSHVC